MPHGLPKIGCPEKPHGEGQHSQNNNGHRMPCPAPHFGNVPPPTEGFMCQFDFDTHKGFLWKKWPKKFATF
jgi:hypothetical protein